MSPQPRDDGRGRRADAPRALGARGFKDVLLRVKDEIRQDNVAMMAAGMAYYAMLALFPALIALITVYGLVASPSQVETTLAGFADRLPGSAAELMRDQLHGIVSASTSALSLGLVLATLAALWSASSGATGMIKAVNRAYDEPERRGFIAVRGLALLFTLGGLLVCAVAIGLLAVLPALFEQLGLGPTGRTVVTIVQYLLLAALVIAGLALLYRHAPCRTTPKTRWVTWGSVIATVLWLAATAAFDFYASRFGSYQETYGALGGVILLLLWLFISSFAVLVGAEINAELEAQTGRDTTVGAPRPMGERGAQKADELGEAMG